MISAPDRIAEKPWLHIPIAECHEPLATIDFNLVARFDPHPYEALGAQYPKNITPFMLRIPVAEALYAAQAELSQRHPGWKLKIFDALRPNTVQAMLVDLDRNSRATADGVSLDGLKAGDHLYDEYQALTLQYWSIPSEDPTTPPLHSTGAAIDLTIQDENGDEINMGVPVDHLDQESRFAYYENIDPIVHANRILLKEVMESASFRGHPKEYWHWGMGDQMSMWLLNGCRHENAQPARYGRYDRIIK